MTDKINKYRPTAVNGLIIAYYYLNNLLTKEAVNTVQ